jgi:hypothetical protein
MGELDCVKRVLDSVKRVLDSVEGVLDSVEGVLDSVEGVLDIVEEEKRAGQYRGRCCKMKKRVLDSV